ncbi:tyrosine-type recombinase/integrase [Pseudomonas asiatica]|uniref:Integrase arm-type DNA-binding domain-containing protein n=1 Tax=Pseudomonas asiatica TaxID=2219225 RepID=A0A9X4CZM3_9PSED|nr:integrase arm-type DNA-binding domain-containing protein [Pseudomonas asiatica]MDD2106819.1 integrase arm-type DNA-binding domain-containing protein [Pseudomonas asiatica]
MARTVTPLTDPKCEAAKPRDKDYKLFDGQGLYLLVKMSGVKTWRFKFTRPDGREGLATFGNYPALSLKAARDRRADALELLAHEQDPVEAAKLAKIEAANARTNTFEAQAREWHLACARKWSPGHAATVLRRLELHLFPSLGARPVAELKARDLLAPLKAVEKRDTLELASRLRQHVTGIMRMAVQAGHIDSNPAYDLQGATATRKTAHRPALPLERLPELLERIEDDGGRSLTRLALQITLLVFIRSSELRFARWDEIDFERALWTIPGERQPIEGVRHSHRGAKMATPHLVPLSRQALALLGEIRQLTGRFDLVFAGDHYYWKPMSENTVNKALRRMGYDTQKDVCGHGFRAMACSALVESGLWSRDAVERQMSHQERNGVRAAYIHKAEHMEERRLMCQWWADYLDACREKFTTPFEFAHRGKDAANVVPIKRA